MDGKTFAGKFLSRLEKIDKSQIEAFLTDILKEKDFLEIVFHSLLEGVVVTDNASRILFINQAALRLLGLGSRSRPQGMSVLKFIKDPNLNEFFSGIDPSSNQVLTRELEVSYPNPAYYLVSAVPIEEEGNISSLVFIINDLTAKRQCDIEQMEEEKLTSLAKLTAGIAHEIKNPLNSLNIHAQLIKQAIEKKDFLTKLADRQRFLGSVDIILEEISRLVRIINQFIIAARPTKPDFAMKNVNKLIERIVEVVKPELDERNIKLTVVMDPEVPATLIDEQQFHQALLNIVRNSMEAIDKPEGLIEIMTNTVDDYLQITVSDNGCGIAEDGLRKIFEPYYTTKFAGSGLGLMIVYRVIKEHNGQVDVNSKPGEGTTFTIRIPLTEKPVRLLEESAGVRHEEENPNS